MKNKIDNNIYFKLFANCIPVRGAKRSIICDIDLNKYKHIPNSLFEVLTNCKNRNVGEVKSFYENNIDEGIDKYFSLLLEEGWGFLTDHPNSFPEIDTTWETPSAVKNAILDLSSTSTYNVEMALVQLEELGCEGVQIRCFTKVDFEIIRIISKATLNTGFSYVEFILKYDTTINESNYFSLLSDNFRIRNLIIHSSIEDKTVNPQNETLLVGKLHYCVKHIDSESHCGIIDESFFNSNISLYTESLQFNSCLNRKISIDKNGEIKNCPSMSLSYGNIKNTTLITALRNDSFKKTWFINKDQIEVCKDCEFRYICTDCRAYTQNKNDAYSKPLKCSYNPYTATWEK